MNNNAQAVIIPDGCASIGSKAFAGCKDLHRVYVHASVEKIADDAFSGCPEGLYLVVDEGSYAMSWAEERGIMAYIR